MRHKRDNENKMLMCVDDSVLTYVQWVFFSEELGSTQRWTREHFFCRVRTPRILLYEFYSILLYDSSRVLLFAGLSRYPNYSTYQARAPCAAHEAASLLALFVGRHGPKES